MADSPDWQHCGHAHHFIASDSCRFHRATFVADGKILVSTVGDYRPFGLNGKRGERETIGAGDDAYFETMVFHADPKRLDDGCPNVIDWSGITTERYPNAQLANAGHVAHCIEYDQIVTCRTGYDRLVTDG